MVRRVGRVAAPLAVLLSAVALGTGPRAGADADSLPIVDTHLHYSQNSWDEYSPEAILAVLDRAGVRRAFVSSTPDDGTVRLYEAAPGRVVPVLRPYRTPGELGSWHRDPTVPGYLETRLRRGIYRGIGEFHLRGEEARSAVVQEVTELATRNDLFLHCHCDAEAVEVLLGLGRELRVLWAHAGTSSGPDEVGRLVDRYPDLTVELALRSDVAPGGRLDPAWRALFLRHPDRFMIGTDTWVPSRWGELPAAQNWTRTWLRQLPPEGARRIASENAERLARGGR
ncbi:MAG: amidohydrolase family protein [Candidatus Rokubacteria bacterium]|nr:amidohydrolase family protein [Candidatus Rokubacteria bacterium]